ncbi:MAG: PrsW family intramembrane metalloprotease [Chloroflexi bacterium]|nr:PrsW family intramembrane metalloprotease [Chloroflexota bacterium]
MQSNKTHWASILTLAVLSFGVLFLFLVAAAFGVASLISLFAEVSAAGEMIAAFAFGFDALLLLVCIWFVYQKMTGWDVAELPFIVPFAWWQVAAGAGVVFFSILAGGFAAVSGINWLGWLILPLLTLFVIAIPIWLVFGIGSNGLDTRPRWRFFAVFGLSLTLAPAVMIALELMAAIMVLVGGVVYLASAQPDLFLEISNVMERLAVQPENQELFLQTFAPYLSNPWVIAVGIGYIAIIVPLIEELFKPLALWLFGGKLTSPAQGFVLGMLSGAAFSIFESLNASADGSAAWALIVSARAGTGILHIVTSGLMGWGIASAFIEKRYGRLAACYGTAVLLHGVWNAAAGGLGVVGMGEMIGRPEWLFAFAPALFCCLIVMGIGMFVVLVASNRKMKKLEAPSQVEPSAT